MAANIESGIARDLVLRQKRAAAVAAFKTRVQVDGVTRPIRSPVERAFLKEIGASMLFRESSTPSRAR